jgi:outer membrane receptor for ferrienterochelin and colicin
MKDIIKLFLMLFVCAQMNAQQIITGTVSDNENDRLPSAVLYFADTQVFTTTDIEGHFTIVRPSNARLLVASYVGYHNDTIYIADDIRRVDFVLQMSHQLAELVVRGRQRGTYLSRITPIQTEVITKAGLQKMACCNLAESFENSASVTVSFADAVSGARQIQMLGLSGIYTQMLYENVPAMRGVAGAFGWNYVPGPWLESIHVSKGTSSVVNGYESTTGQINLEFKKPNDTETLFLNLFASDDGRLESNLTTATPVGKNLWTGLMIHGSTEQTEHDKHGSGFMDMPKTQLVNLYNRWVYDNHEREIESRTDIRFLHDRREGGQTSEHKEHTIGDLYKIDIENRNFSVSNKTGFMFGHKEGQSIGIINSFTNHEIDAIYGKKTFDTQQYSWYTNVLISSFLYNTNHRYVVGGSFTYDSYNQRYGDELNGTLPTSLSRNEIIPGAFAQYTYSYLEKIIAIVGLRSDYNSHFKRWLFTPRTNIKYNITDDLIFRASAGRGFRSPNVISENIGLLASSRRFYVHNISNLHIEKAWNYGTNLTFYFPMPKDKNLSIGIDYYRTEFQNQIIVDLECNKTEVHFENLQGKSYANAFQLDINATFLKGFDIYTAFRLNDTKITYRNGLKFDKPLVSKYRGLINLSYATNFEKWKIDLTAQINGKSRIPNLESISYEEINNWSPIYPLYYAQITKKTKRLDIYVGCENILDYKQKNPIFNSHDPFGTEFDASIIWGPLMGRKFYAGMRLRLGEIK